jgi:hypothetical protein
MTYEAKIPLYPTVVATLVDYLWIVVFLVTSGVCWGFLVYGYTLLTDLDMWMGLIPLSIRFGFATLMTLSICAVCSIANVKLVMSISLLTSVSYLIYFYVITEHLLDNPPVDTGLHGVLFPILVPQSFGEMLIITIGFYIPLFSGQIRSGIELIYAGAMVGQGYGGFSNMIDSLLKLKDLDANVEPQVKYMIYTDCFMMMSFYSMVGVLGSLFMACQASGLISRSVMWNFASVVVTFAFILSYKLSLVLSHQNEDSMLYFSPIVVFILTAVATISSIMPLRNLATTNLGNHYTPIK